MKKQKMILWLFSLMVIVTLAACTAQPAVQPTSEPVATDAANGDLTVEPVIATNTVVVPSATLTVAPTATAEPTATSQPIAAVEPTLGNVVTQPPAAAPISGSGVFLTLAVNTICRTGPATIYPSVASIPAGLKVQAVGRLATDTNYYFIANPNDPGIHCWVIAKGATVEGNRADLLVVEPLPTPTPKTGADFSVTYSNITQCASDYCFSFRVLNTGKVVWQSIKIYIVDVETKVSASYSSDVFEEWLDCHVDNYQNDLSEGEHAFMTPYNPGHFDYRPWGSTFLIRVTLCTENGLQGTCLTREIKVKP